MAFEASFKGRNRPSNRYQILANTEPDQFNSVHDVTHLFEFEIVRDAKFRSSWINGNTAIGSSDLECCAA